MRNVYNRILKLEKQNVRPRVCSACGAGERLPRGIVSLSKGGSLRECETCGGLIAEDGWPVSQPCVTVTIGDRGFIVTKFDTAHLCQ